MLPEQRWTVGAITSDDVLFSYARHKNLKVVTKREQMYWANGIPVNEKTSIYLGVRSNHWLGGDLLLNLRVADFPKFITMFEESNFTGRGLFNARSMPAHFEPNLLKRWTQECYNNDETCRMSSRIMNGLDVANQQLVIAPRHCQYFALSYVYGGVKINKLAKDLPRTIEDAIQLVEILGYRYLWIDSVCLTKDHLEDHKTRS